MDHAYMKEKKILPLVLSMSVPMVLSMLTNALYNIMYSYFVAKISEDAMTAISLVYPLQNVSGAAAIGFGVGRMQLQPSVLVRMIRRKRMVQHP